MKVQPTLGEEGQQSLFDRAALATKGENEKSSTNATQGGKQKIEGRWNVSTGKKGEKKDY